MVAHLFPSLLMAFKEISAAGARVQLPILAQRPRFWLCTGRAKKAKPSIYITRYASCAASQAARSAGGSRFVGIHPVLQSRQEPGGCPRESVLPPSGIPAVRQKQRIAQRLPSILCFAAAEARSSAGKGPDSFLKFLELHMDLLQLRTWPRLVFFSFLFFFSFFLMH